MNNELTDYLEQNSSQIPDPTPHGSLIEDVIKNLHILGINGPANSYREVRLIENGRYLGAVDIAVQAGTDFYVIEAKTVSNMPSYGNKSLRHRKKMGRKLAHRQLNWGAEFFMRNFSVVPKRVRVIRYLGESGFVHKQLDGAIKTDYR